VEDSFDHPRRDGVHWLSTGWLAGSFVLDNHSQTHDAGHRRIARRPQRCSATALAFASLSPL